MDFLEEHFRKNAPTYTKIATNVLGNRHDLGEDATQETYLRCLMYQDTYDKSQPMEPWINRIFRNCVADIKQQERMKGATTFTEKQLYEPSLVDDEMYSIIKYAKDNYSGDSLDILLLRYEKQMTMLEISQIASMSYISVRKFFSRFTILYKENNEVR